MILKRLIEYDIQNWKPLKTLSEAERRAYLPQEVLMPADWAVDKFQLPEEAYADPGPFTFSGREWQRDILNAYAGYRIIIIIGPVQTGKSLCGIDVPWTWCQDQIGGRCLLVYADVDTVGSVFEEKLKPIIKKNLQHLWNDREKDLRQEKIILQSGISRCGSCNVENDIATFSAKFVFLDEVAKWRIGTRKGFDAVSQAMGRTEDYHGQPGIDYRVSIVSSPKEVGDPLYNQAYAPGTLILKRKVPCLGCGHYHELRRENIHELLNSEGKKDHNPQRIRDEKAAAYVCPECGAIIDDNDRYEMDKRGVWATDEEKVVDGKIQNPDPLRGKTDRVCFWIPGRLISRPEKYPFYECLARFFQAKYSNDPHAFQRYLNEDEARFFVPQRGRVTEAYLRSKADTQYSTESPIPDGVLVATAGIDTQDTEFYYTIIGYGQYMETWILRFGRIPCDMNSSEFKDPEKVIQRFSQYYYKNPLKYESGKVLPVMLALMDEGGHRKNDVHAIHGRIRSIMPYKGLASDRMPEGKLVIKNVSRRCINGHTESLSKIVETHMNSDSWHLPTDVDQEFIDQIQRQYTREEIDKNGNKKYVWVSGGDDHYRDCLNMGLGAAYYLDLHTKLNTESGIRTIRNTVEAQVQKEKHEQENKQIAEKQEQEGRRPAPTPRAIRMHNRFHSQNPFTQRNRLFRGVR